MEALQQKGVMFLSAAGTENHPVSRNLFFTAPVKYSVAAIKAALCELSEGFCFFFAECFNYAARLGCCSDGNPAHLHFWYADFALVIDSIIT